MKKLKKYGYAELEIITKGGQKTKVTTSCKLAFDIVKNQKTRGVYIAEDSTETLAINYDDICIARAVALKGTTPALGYAEKREMRCRPAYIPREVMQEPQGEEVTREDEERDEQEDVPKEPQEREGQEPEVKEKPCPQAQKPFGGGTRARTPHRFLNDVHNEREKWVMDRAEQSDLAKEMLAAAGESTEGISTPEVYKIECKCGAEYTARMVIRYGKAKCRECGERLYYDEKEARTTDSGDMALLLTNRYFVNLPKQEGKADTET